MQIYVNYEITLLTSANIYTLLRIYTVLTSAMSHCRHPRRHRRDQGLDFFHLIRFFELVHRI